MILTIDVGNTKVNFGIFDDGDLVLRFSLASSKKTTVEKCRAKLQVFLTSEMKIDGAICCSVVPYMTNIMISFVEGRLGIPFNKIDPKDDIGVINRYFPPDKVGADRLVNALAVKHLYSLPAIIIDLGTAVTIDVMTAQNEYIGGVIAPGLGMSANALHKETSLLPKADLMIPSRILGTDTLSSIQSGLTYGFAAMVKGVVKGIKEEQNLPDAAVVLTGGHTRVLYPLLNDVIDHIDENLTLKGLNLAYSLL